MKLMGIIQGSVWIVFIVENWKYYSKIIFKCVNNTVRLNFKVVFKKKNTCESCEQCMEPKKNAWTLMLTLDTLSNGSLNPILREVM